MGTPYQINEIEERESRTNSIQYQSPISLTGILSEKENGCKESMIMTSGIVQVPQAQKVKENIVMLQTTAEVLLREEKKNACRRNVWPGFNSHSLVVPLVDNHLGEEDNLGSHL